MVEQPNANEFTESAAKQLTLPDAISKARLAIAAITEAPLDSIKSCVRDAQSQWVATVEVIESPARMGDNDLISAYEMTMDDCGELLGFQRVGRYHREDGAAA